MKFSGRDFIYLVFIVIGAIIGLSQFERPLEGLFMGLLVGVVASYITASLIYGRP